MYFIWNTHKIYYVHKKCWLLKKNLTKSCKKKMEMFFQFYPKCSAVKFPKVHRTFGWYHPPEQRFSSNKCSWTIIILSWSEMKASNQKEHFLFISWSELTSQHCTQTVTWKLWGALGTLPPTSRTLSDSSHSSKVFVPSPTGMKLSTQSVRTRSHDWETASSTGYELLNNWLKLELSFMTI